jgi:hypothetical protein
MRGKEHLHLRAARNRRKRGGKKRKRNKKERRNVNLRKKVQRIN